jgi:regulator of replication initiation timing
MEAMFPTLADLETKVIETADEIRRLKAGGGSGVGEDTKAALRERIQKIINLIEEVEKADG